MYMISNETIINQNLNDLYVTNKFHRTALKLKAKRIPMSAITCIDLTLKFKVYGLRVPRIPDRKCLDVLP